MRPPYPALAAFAAALAFVEAAVVVYLRALYLPAGMSFPVAPIPRPMAVTEMAREAATLVMMAAVAWIAGAGRRSRFAAFAFVFALWDLLYYGFLKLLTGWPASLLDPDMLFLIPWPWVGPVLAPALVSLFLIALAFLLAPPRGGPGPSLRGLDWGLLLGGAGLVLLSFLQPNMSASPLERPVAYPGRYPWEVFGLGFFLGSAAVIRMALRARRP